MGRLVERAELEARRSVERQPQMASRVARRPHLPRVHVHMHIYMHIYMCIHM